MKRKFDTKFIFDMRGFWANERVDGNLWNLSKPHYKLVYNFFKKKEKQFLTEADYVISLTNTAKTIIERDWNISNNIEVIPCCVDINHFQPKSQNIISENLTLGYLGSIGTWYMLDEMLEFFKILLRKYPKAKFLFITKDEPENILKLTRIKEIDENKIIIKPAKRNEVPQLLTKVDLGIFFILPAFSKQSSSPTKQGEFMSMGIPVITNAGVGDTDFIVNKYNSGLLVRTFTENEYVNIINQIDDLLLMNKSKIIIGATEYFSLENGISKYNNIYRKLLSLP